MHYRCLKRNVNLGTELFGKVLITICLLQMLYFAAVSYYLYNLINL